MEPTEQTSAQPTPQERVAALHRACAADYNGCQATREAAARNQLAEARMHGNEAAGTR